MNATAPAPTSVSSDREYAHIRRWSETEWLAAFESGALVTAYCGARQAPRLNANDLPVCPRCRRLADGPLEPAPLW